ncbi:MAG: hypothetical protein C0489_12370 [Candidatus Accumulibacter sp.]|nr:hypothetical protein [Accumulibacter sp.]
MIAQPSVPGALQTLRLPVTTSDTEVQYLKTANWVEQPSKLFQRLLVDTVGATGGVLVLSERQSDVAAARKLTGQLVEFGLDVRGSPQVRVRYDALLSGSDGKPVASLLACQLETGRTHQIRVHLAHLGHPLMGDDVYGAGFKTKARQLGPKSQAALTALGRQGLHAYLLVLEHPSSGEILHWESALPEDLVLLEAALRSTD